MVALVGLTLAASTTPVFAMTKAQEFAMIDPSITATKLVGNPDKYAGKYVKLSCTVQNAQSAPNGGLANVDCGQEQPSTIIIFGSKAAVGNLDARQQIHFIGWVRGGFQNSASGSGGQVYFAAVRYDYAL